jgi:hypothetical protein
VFYYLVPLAIALICVVFAAIYMHDKKMENCFMWFLAGMLFTYMAGTLYYKFNNSYLIISKIVQEKDRYVVTAWPLKIIQKQCSYKVGDTLWIKK